MKASMTICFPVYVELDVDESRILEEDEDYIEEVKGKAEDLAAEIMETSTITPFVSDSNVSELID